MIVPIVLTNNAVQKILEVMKQDVELNQYLRVGVRGGGCSGLQYILDFTNQINDFDLEFKQETIKIVIDQMSAGILEGTTIDYTDSLAETGFKFDNPKTKRSCGCNKSFSI